MDTSVSVISTFDPGSAFKNDPPASEAVLPILASTYLTTVALLVNINSSLCVAVPPE